MRTVEHMEIRAAQWPDDLDAARGMLRHYADFLQNNPAGPVDVCISDFEDELASLAQRYAEPSAVLLLAFADGVAVGCVAVKQRPDRPGECEMKRLWTQPTARGTGLGKALTETAMNWARAHGAHTLLLDTVAAAMPDALRLYQRMGFTETERHNTNTVSGLLFMKICLR